MFAALSTPSYPIAFVAGVVSFLSPCVFPLMPAYAAYVGGGVDRDSSTDGRGRVIAGGAAFVLGFSLVFVAVFYVLQVLDVTVFRRNIELVNRIAGAVIMVLALQVMGVLRLGFLMRERRLHVTANPGPRGAFLLGLSFAAGWTPCLGPQLGAILTVAQNRDFGGLPFMLVYCLGLAVPFLIIALLAERLQGFIRRVNRRLGVISIVAGAVLFAFGLLVATGKVALLSTYALQSPFDV